MKKIGLMAVVACMVLFGGCIFAEEKVLCDFEGSPETELAKFRMPNECLGTFELVPGKMGNNALKVTFQPGKTGGSRYWSLNMNKIPEMDPRSWVESKYKTLKFWVKGDGSDKRFGLTAEHWDVELNKATASCNLVIVALNNPEWQQIVIPLDDKYGTLRETDSVFFGSPLSEEGFSYTIDHITAE